MISIHLDKGTCSHSPVPWCGIYDRTAGHTTFVPDATCLECLRVALKETTRLRDHYLNEMNSARAREQTLRERVGR